MKKIFFVFATIYSTFSLGQSLDDFVVEIYENRPDILINAASGTVVDYGNGNFRTLNSSGFHSIGHNYGSNNGPHIIRISGQINSIDLDGSTTNLIQWGSSQWQNLDHMFEYCTDLVITATDTPDLSQCISMNGTFNFATNFNSDISDWDVSNVTNMSSMFSGARFFNQPIGSWDVSNVTDMSNMFGAATFNQSLSSWDVSSCTNMSGMFSGAQDFNQDISSWDVSNVTDMSYMFSSTARFNQLLSNWDVSNVTDMSGMFSEAEAFNRSLNGWNVSNVRTMEFMFIASQRFNSAIDQWDVSNVENTRRMFMNSERFDQNINSWDVSNVTNMNEMFAGSIRFNQPLNDWDISNVVNLVRMFDDARQFDQSLDDWDFSNVLFINNFLTECSLSTENYDSLLERWVDFPNLSGSIGTMYSRYCNSFSRDILISNGWYFDDRRANECADNNVSGTLILDIDQNSSCDINTDLVLVNVPILISNSNFNHYIFSNLAGNFQTTLPDGNYTITASVDQNQFNLSPNMSSFNISGSSSFLQDFCLTAITPANDLEVIIMPLDDARPGFDTDYKLIYTNNGNTQISGTVDFSYEDDFMDLLNADPAADTSSAGSLSWNFIDLNPFESREIEISMNLNTPTDPTFPLNSNDVLNFTASISPSSNDATPQDNTYDLDQIVVNSYDPNDKTCLEGNTISPERAGEYVHYRIRFENEGTASAVNVRIIDYLDDSKFDISSFKPISSSHDYVAQITDGNKLEFIFDNINLPHTAPDSEGYVLFKIKTLNTLVLGDSFSNQAEIYFDFNFPIVTNLETTSITNTASVETVANIDFRLYPNPAQEAVVITSNIEFDGVTVYDLRGVQVSHQELEQHSDRFSLKVSSLSKGVYLVNISNENGGATKRLIVE